MQIVEGDRDDSMSEDRQTKVGRQVQSKETWPQRHDNNLTTDWEKGAAELMSK